MGLRLFLLGPMRAYVDEAAIKLPPRSRLLSLWGYLLVHRSRPMPRNLLAYTFWPDESEEEARLNLRRHLHRLAQLLPATEPAISWIVSDRSTVQWNPSADAWLDLADFERVRTDPARLVEAADLYTGDLLEGIYDDWVFAERERLRDAYSQVLHQLVERSEAEKDYRQAILFAQRLLRHDPLREETYRTLMRLHAQSGDRAGLVRHFNACVTVLQRELHVEPSLETRQAYEAYLSQDVPGGEAAPPPARSGPAQRHNLPARLTSFIGRRRELEEMRGLLAKTRLLTLTGIGGVGKTRLALALAEANLNRFADGVWWVDLAPLSDPSLLGQAVASAMGLREQSTRPIDQALADAVHTKDMLIVLDSCEHLVADCARLVEGLLREGPRMRFLTTSTEPLGVPGEVVWQVPPLSLPEPVESGEAAPPVELGPEASASVRLFADRAAAVLPTFRLTPGNLPSVVRLCRALDGIPLALELAAARMKMLSVDQLVERLDDRFRLLTGGSRTALPRHRTLRAVLDWSYGLLSETERALLRRLSLFVGGFTLESAEAVCLGDPVTADQILQLLSELVDRSLVMVSREDPARVRYGLLETVGHYAREKLVESGEADRVQAAFVAYWLNLVEEAGDRLLRGPDQEKWFWVIGQEYANLRSTMSYAEGAGDMVTLARLTSRLWPFWWTHGYVAEGRRWLEIILPRRATLPEELKANVLHAAGRLMSLQGDYALAGELLDENLAICRKLGDLSLIADALSSRGVVASNLQDYDRADEIWKDALQVYEAQGDRWGVARALNNLGDLSVYRGDYAGAIEHLQKSVNLFRELRSTLGESISLINLGRAALLLGKAQRAALFFRESLQLKVALADKEGIAWNLEGLAGVAGAEGQADRAARLFGAADTLRKAIGIPLPAPDLPMYERMVDKARLTTEPARWQASWKEGEAMDTEQALAYALGSSSV
ncbi:MAG TPA: tetratricopeptide repeat protein [Anaerolineales bacterium]|nr:tetratricopeptide repeat protein [Anaerolineales bacterium]